MVLAFTCRFSLWREAIAVPTVDAQISARAFYDLIITRHGFVNTLQSDRGSNFLAKMMRELYVIMGVKKVSTTAYHPSCNGRIERFSATTIL